MYVEKKKIGKNEYSYLKESVRIDGKVKTRTVAYLGKGIVAKKRINEKIMEITKKQDINLKFFSEIEFKKLASLKDDFNKKIRLDKKLVEDMYKDFKTYYIYNTNAIEGNTMTLEETSLLLNENRSPEGKDLREIYDHINEKETFDYILKEKPALNKDTIISVHEMLLKKIDNRIGKFRSHKVRVFGSSLKTSPPEYIETDIKILLNWLNKNDNLLHPLIISSLFHEKFERIHPFYDGNGRTGRMLSNLILLRNGFPPLIIKNKDRKEYYEVLSAGHKAGLDMIDIGNYKPIVNFFYAQIIKTYEEVFSKWG